MCRYALIYSWLDNGELKTEVQAASHDKQLLSEYLLYIAARFFGISKYPENIISDLRTWKKNMILTFHSGIKAMGLILLKNGGRKYGYKS